MSGILARIKALFEERRQAPPRQEIEAAPTPAALAPEIAEPPLPERVVTVEEPPVPQAAPPRLVVPVAPPAQEAMPILQQAPAAIDEAPAAVEEAPAEVEATVPAAPAGGLTLRLERERGSGSTFQVTKSGATIGRGPESTIQLADLSVSRKHAKITYKQGAYWLSDLGSMGGTWIDGAKLAAPRRVAKGQTIDIGLCRLTVVASAESDATGVAKGPSNAA